MPRVLQLSNASLPSSVSSIPCPSGSADSGGSFSDALQSAHSKSDQRDNSTDTASAGSSAQTSIKPKSNRPASRKPKQDAGNTPTPDTESEDPSEQPVKASQTDESVGAGDAKAAPANVDDSDAKACKASDAELAAAAAQNVNLPPSQAASTKKQLPQAATTPTPTAIAADAPALLTHARPSSKLAPQGPADVGAKFAPDVSQDENDAKDVDDNTQNSQPLTAVKPAIEQKEKAAEKAAAQQDQDDPQSTFSAQSPTATPQAAAASSTTSAALATQLSSAPQHETSVAAHDSVTPTISTMHATASQSSSRADSASEAQESPSAAPDQTFEQVVLGLKGKIDAQNGKAEIHLNPPNLGTLHVSINLEKGNLTAQFQSGSASVRDLLKANMEKLKTVLETSGVSVDKLSVESPTGPSKSTPTPQTATANQDGRSAGEYTQDQRRKKSDDGGAFAKLWQNAAQDQSPLDLVA